MSISPGNFAARNVDRTNRSDLMQWSPLRTRREAWTWRSRASVGHASPPAQLRGERPPGPLEARHGRIDEPGADLADPRLAVGDAGVDLGQDAGLEHEPDVDP